MDIGKDLAKAYDDGYEQGKKDAMQWVSVNDRLPEETKQYLTYDGGYDLIDVVSYYVDCGKWNCSYKITHWMPLPPKPEGE
jgi:hypothetical protein